MEINGLARRIIMCKKLGWKVEKKYAFEKIDLQKTGQIEENKSNSGLRKCSSRA